MVKHISQYVRACPCYESLFLYQTKYGGLANIICKPALIILLSTDGQLLRNEQTNQVGEKVNSQQDKSQMLYLNEPISSTALRRTFKTVQQMLWVICHTSPINVSSWTRTSNRVPQQASKRASKWLKMIKIKGKVVVN